MRSFNCPVRFDLIKIIKYINCLVQYLGKDLTLFFTINNKNNSSVLNGHFFGGVNFLTFNKIIFILLIFKMLKHATIFGGQNTR